MMNLDLMGLCTVKEIFFVTNQTYYQVRNKLFVSFEIY